MRPANVELTTRVRSRKRINESRIRGRERKVEKKRRKTRNKKRIVK